MDLKISEERLNSDLNALDISYSNKVSLKKKLSNGKIEEILPEFFDAYYPMLQNEEGTYMIVLRYLMNICREINNELLLRIIGNYKKEHPVIHIELQNIFETFK